MKQEQTRYRGIQVPVPFCIREHEHTSLCQGKRFWPVDALECIGTGLAIQKIWYQPQRWDDYGLMHIASGTLLVRYTVPTLVEAGMWLRQVKALSDWTQPTHKLKEQPEIEEQVYFAWLSALHDGYVLQQGKKILSDASRDDVESPTSEGMDKA